MWALYIGLLLILKYTFRNILRILEPLDKGQKPLIKSVLEGRHFFIDEFWRVGTMGMASTSVEIHFQKYNMYFRTIRKRPDSLDQHCSQGQACHQVLFGSGAAGLCPIVLTQNV